jgi:YbbR domain-containing protein
LEARLRHSVKSQKAWISKPALKLVVATLTLFIFLFILLMFIFACTRENVETNLLLPIGFSSLPADLVRIPSNYTNLEIRIKGPAKLVENASQEEITYLVDLYTDLAMDPAGTVSSIEPGFYSIPIMNERIPLNPRITILKVKPSYVTVHLEQKMIKRLPVHVPYAGEAAPGFTALDAATVPKVVEVTGARSTIEPLMFIMTKPADITNAKEDFKKNLPLDLAPSTTVDPPGTIVVASIPIVETIVTQNFENLKITTINNSNSISVVPPFMDIKVKGPLNTLKKDGIKETFKIYIDLEGLTPGVYVRRAAITLPVGLILADTKPELFTVTIHHNN